MTPEDVVERLRYNFEQFVAGNRQPFLDFLADDVVCNLPSPRNMPWHGRHVGRRAFIHVFDQIADAFDFESVELLDVFGSGDRYALLMHERVRVRSTGKIIDHDQLILYRIKNGRILEYQEFGDTDAIRFGLDA